MVLIIATTLEADPPEAPERAAWLVLLGLGLTASICGAFLTTGKRIATRVVDTLWSRAVRVAATLGFLLLRAVLTGFFVLTR